MLQIKTIKNRLYNVDDFDKEVNEAIAAGWKLTRREVLQPAAQAIEYTYIMLYAELEKNILTEDEKTCENCKYGNVPGNIPPCADCNPDGGKCYWEAAE